MGDDRTWTLRCVKRSGAWNASVRGPEVTTGPVSVVEERRLREAEAETYKLESAISRMTSKFVTEELRAREVEARAERAEGALLEAREALAFYADEENWEPWIWHEQSTPNRHDLHARPWGSGSGCAHEGR